MIARFRKDVRISDFCSDLCNAVVVCVRDENLRGLTRFVIILRFEYKDELNEIFTRENLNVRDSARVWNCGPCLKN